MEHTTQTDAQLLHDLETKINELAPSWRSAKRTGETERATAIVRQYQAVLRCMIELGFKDELDIDAELPDQLLPPEYLALHGRN